MKRIRWKWLPLVLLLSPLVYWAGWWSASWWLEPKPRYTLGFESGPNAARIDVFGQHLAVDLMKDESTPTDGNRRKIFRLSDGQFINEHIVMAEMQPREIVDDLQGLSSEARRYEMFLNRFFGEPQDYILIDQVTGKKHRFIRQPKDSYYSCELNRSHTHCLAVEYVFDNKVNSLLGTMFAPCSPSMAGHLISLAQVLMPSTDKQKVELISVVTVPEKRVVTPAFVNRYMAFRDGFDRITITIRNLSPSGRWIVIGDDSEHAPGPKQERKWTTLYLYDTGSHQWHGKLTTLDSILSDIEFLSDELLMVNFIGADRFAKRVAVHVPTGKLIDEIRDKTESMLSQLRTDSIYVYPDEPQNALKYIKIEDNRSNGSDLTLRVVDQSGMMSIVKKREFSFSLHGGKPCRGSQVYAESAYERPLPKWIIDWLPKGKVHDLIKGWMNRQMHLVYDFTNDQIIKGWPKNTSACVSADGSTLVIKELAADDSVQRVQVYDLPLPVWSPWWSRVAGITLVLLLCLLLVRRRGVVQQQPVPLKP